MEAEPHRVVLGGGALGGGPGMKVTGWVRPLPVLVGEFGELVVILKIQNLLKK